MKTFERHVLSHLETITNPHLDPLQFAYRSNRSVDDSQNGTLDATGTYSRILFVDFGSAFNTIIPARLQDKLPQVKCA